MHTITVTAVSKDHTRVFIAPNGDTARGIWWPVGEPLEAAQFPASPAPRPRLRLAAPGEGKGVKGGFSSLRRRA